MIKEKRVNQKRLEVDKRVLTTFCTNAKYASNKVSENLNPSINSRYPDFLAVREKKHNARIPTSTLVIRIPNVIDPDPKREQRIITRPRCRTRFISYRRQELVHLISQRQDSRSVWSYKVGVDGRSAVGIVVCEEEGFVELDGVEVDPVCSADCCEALCNSGWLEELEKKWRFNKDLQGKAGCREGCLQLGQSRQG